MVGGLITIDKLSDVVKQETELRNNILQYTDEMEVFYYGETDEGKDYEYFGQATIGLQDEIIVTRFDYTESVKLLTMCLFGDITYDEISETDNIFKLDKMVFISYETETEDEYHGHQLTLKADDPIEIVFDDYLSSLRAQIEYADIE